MFSLTTYYILGITLAIKHQPELASSDHKEPPTILSSIYLNHQTDLRWISSIIPLCHVLGLSENGLALFLCVLFYFCIQSLVSHPYWSQFLKMIGLAMMSLPGPWQQINAVPALSTDSPSTNNSDICSLSININSDTSSLSIKAFNTLKCSGQGSGENFNDPSSNNSAPSGGPRPLIDALTCSSTAAPSGMVSKGSNMALTVRLSPRGSTLYNLFPINVRPKYPLSWEALLIRVNQLI